MKEEHDQLSLLERWDTSSHFPVTTAVITVIDLSFRASNYLYVEGSSSSFRFIRLTREMGGKKKKKKCRDRSLEWYWQKNSLHRVTHPWTSWRPWNLLRKKNQFKLNSTEIFHLKEVKPNWAQLIVSSGNRRPDTKTLVIKTEGLFLRLSHRNWWTSSAFYARPAGAERP